MADFARYGEALRRILSLGLMLASQATASS